MPRKVHHTSCGKGRRTARGKTTRTRRTKRRKRYSGGSLWSWLKKAGKTIAKVVKPLVGLVRKHKLISKGLSLSGNPKAQMAGTVASAIGLGKRRYRRRRRRRGGALKLAGMGYHRIGHGGALSLA